MAAAQLIYHLVPTLITKLELVPMKTVFLEKVSYFTSFYFIVFLCFKKFIQAALFIQTLNFNPFSGMNKQKENLHASRSYEELNDVCFEGFLTLGEGKNDNSQKFNSLRNAGQVNIFTYQE